MILLHLIDIAGNAIMLISASLDFGSIQAGAYILCQLVVFEDVTLYPCLQLLSLLIKLIVLVVSPIFFSFFSGYAGYEKLL